MFVSQDNKLRNINPSVLNGLSGDLAQNIASADASLSYTASGNTLVFGYGSVQQVSYILVAGTNLEGHRIIVLNGAATVKSRLLTRNNVTMLVFDPINFGDLRVRISGGATAPTVFHIAGGTALQMPNGGEISGYARNWLARSVRSKTTTNKSAAPTAALLENQPLRGQLSIPNAPASFSQNEWQLFYDFAASEGVFYITEQAELSSTDAEASYICFDPQLKAPTAHQQTRALNNLSVSFRCFNGL